MDKFSELKAVERFDADIEENGGEPFAVWVTAINGSHVFAKDYDALLAELEQKEKLRVGWKRLAKLNIAELEEGVSELDKAMARIAELEAKLATPVDVKKLTVIECEEVSGQSREYCEGWCAANDWAIHHIRAAGFKVEGGEQ